MSLRLRPGTLALHVAPLALALAGLASACSGTSGVPTVDPAAGSGTGDAGSATSDAPPAPNAAGETGTGGCGAAGFTPGLSSKTTSVGGVSRRYQLFVPAGYDATQPMRLVFVFHGLGGNGDQIRAYFGFEDESAGKALFVYPDGLPQADMGGRTAWSPDDLKLFDALVSEISATHCVDKSRIFAAGHSFGGYMSNLVGCERGDVVRAIAPVSGGIVAGTCKGPVAAWLAHGDKDGTVPPSEGTTARDHWLKANGCKASSRPTPPSPCVTYDGCSAGRPVTWCSFAGGHYPLPAFTQQAIWDFFAAL